MGLQAHNQMVPWLGSQFPDCPRGGHDYWWCRRVQVMGQASGVYSSLCLAHRCGGILLSCQVLNNVRPCVLYQRAGPATVLATCTSGHARWHTSWQPQSEVFTGLPEGGVMSPSLQMRKLRLGRLSGPEGAEQGLDQWSC